MVQENEVSFQEVWLQDKTMATAIAVWGGHDQHIAARLPSQN